MEFSVQFVVPKQVNNQLEVRKEQHTLLLWLNHRERLTQLLVSSRLLVYSSENMLHNDLLYHFIKHSNKLVLVKTYD